MPQPEPGWAWFDRSDGDPAGQPTDLAEVFARCFRGGDGTRALAHLRSATLDRALGPGASEAQLRHLEGQRQLVAAILALVERGRRGAPL